MEAGKYRVERLAGNVDLGGGAAVDGGSGSGVVGDLGGGRCSGRQRMQRSQSNGTLSLLMGMGYSVVALLLDEAGLARAAKAVG